MTAPDLFASPISDELTRLARGFQDSRVFLTGLELDVFTTVGEGATSRAVAERLGTDLRATDILLSALASIGLLVKTGETFACTELASVYLVAGARSRLALAHNLSIWARWSTLTECVRVGHPTAPTCPRCSRSPSATSPSA